MMDPLRAKVTALGIAALAFAFGLLTASGLEWTRGGEAAETRFSATLQTPQRRDVAPLDEMSRGFNSIARAVTPAVVSVQTEGAPHASLDRGLPPNVPQPFEEWFRRFYRSPQQEEVPYDVPLGNGSGFIVSADGYILTNNHVVARADKITVELSDGRRLPARLVGRDPTTDVAVIKIEEKGLPTLPLGNSDQIQIGEWVLAVGNPGFGDGNTLNFTVTAGIVSAQGRSIDIIRRSSGSNYAIEDFIQTDAVINPGNSGGPLVNTKGEAIGMNTAIASRTGYYQGYGFAIPINLVKSVMNDLVEYGRVRRAALGVQIRPVDPADAKAFNLPEVAGVSVQDFTEDSPAQAAGIQRGDVIVAVNGDKVERVGQLQQIIAGHKPGETVEIRVIRYGEPRTVRVRLTEAPVPEPEPTTRTAAARPGSKLGMQFETLDRELARQAQIPDRVEREGVLITSVDPYSPAQRAGLAQGMIVRKVNQKQVRSAAELDRILEGLKAGDVASFDVVIPLQEGVQRAILNVEIPA